ncbi:DUF4249 domain-containing protein [Algoriphagus boritolerans]|uniref:DUF4249 domain-containing protein n=1 Tax=Algoriphagus boritolerans DSM 17298 = JCM 18970 TaxID=1120964 RepID=A0A1H5SVP3_9BACT|nr:DUF4249 domain-containing protein [Algoriphagus boritolerans]SEF54600.1 protein of unknown function [Algoriphagus boritolerans DSM 17298 = JCM 18970]
MLKRLINLFLLLPMACIDPYEVTVPDGQQLLTVEGLIHTGPGPHAITLTRSDTYGSVFEGLIRPVTGATVVVRDDEGRITFLAEGQDSRGSYFTPVGFQAEIGKSYTLQIQTADERVYTSLPERVESVPEIEDIGVKTVTIPVEGEIIPRSGVQLISEINDPADQNNFYFWRLSPVVHVLEARPDLFTDREFRTSAPKDCCSVCYRTESTGNQSLFIAQDDNFNGLNTRIPAAFIEDNGLRFVNTLRVDLKQYAISQEAFRFLRLVKQQAEISGSIFDPPPATIRGNMISLDNPDEVVLGYFMAAGESTRRIYISKADLTFQQNAGIIPDDCRTVSGASVNPPFDWNP